jgi:hypothetical protein
MAKTQYTKTVAQTEDQILAMVGQAQAAVIDAVSTVSERVAGFLPEIPELPYAEQVPSPAEFVGLWFGSMERLLAVQKDYATALVEALAPITGKLELGPKAAPRRTAPVRKAA